MSCFKIIELEQGTPEWLDFRKKHIGASDAPVIMNESPWKTPLKLWQEKLGLRQDKKQTLAMKRGTDLEPIAREAYMKLTGHEVKPIVAVSLDRKMMSASYDGVTSDYKHAVEIKCPNKDDHALALEGKIPRKYLYQLLQQMLVLGIDHADYFSYANEKDVALVTLILKEVEREAEELIKQEEKFWSYVENMEEPPMQKRDLVEMKSLEWGLTVDEYLAVKQQLKELEAKEKAFKEQLIAMANGENCYGSGIKLSQYTRKGTIDYAEIPEIKSIDLNRYRKPPISGWVINVDKSVA